MAAPLQTPAQILQRFYDAETIYMAAPSEERDIAAMAGTLSPTVKLFQSPDLPYPGEYEGLDGFERWTKAMASWFDKLEVTDPRVFEKSDSDQVVVLSTLKLRVRATGQPWVCPLAQAIKVDRVKGVITEIRPFYWDVQGLNRAVGFQPQ